MSVDKNADSRQRTVAAHSGTSINVHTSALRKNTAFTYFHSEIDPIAVVGSNSNPQLTGARHVGNYRVWLLFADGREGIVDFSDDLWGEALAPLQNLDTFAELSFDDALATLTWERGGIDISPSYLYSKLERLQ